jgi:hypothetical protein
VRGLRLAVALLAVLALGAFAGTARADNAADARAVADRFMTALLANDGAAVCSLFSPRALAVFGGNDCVRLFSEVDSSDRDYEALETLRKAYGAARKSSARRRGDFVRKHFTIKQLARDMERIDSDLTVKVGKGPLAANKQLPTTAVLDARTTARRVVIYVEGDSGTIYRASGTAFSDPAVGKVAQGTPEGPATSPPTPKFTIDSVTLSADAKAYVTATILDPETSRPAGTFVLLLVPSAQGYLVDDILISLVGTIASLGPAG